jgi:pyruvate formate lyase activating enzyme
MPKRDAEGLPVRPLTGLIWDIKKYAIHDGPGIRTTVFFKGCPLRCPWCCNPEAQGSEPEIIHVKENCIHCNHCLAVCPSWAISVDKKGTRRIFRSRCNTCGFCATHCPNQAMNIVGKRMTASEILRVVLRDAVFYERSGGGLTLSGGEPAAQPEFACQLLRQFKLEERGGHTAIETCGFVPWSNLQRILEHTDLVLYDIKHMDAQRHLRSTGVDNKLILQNAKLIPESGVRLVIRFPLIPGFNDSEENIRRTADFARQLPGVEELHILPYHRLGEPKYLRLGRKYKLSGVRPLERSRLAKIRTLLESYGLRVKIGG